MHMDAYKIITLETSKAVEEKGKENPQEEETAVEERTAEVEQEDKGADEQEFVSVYT